MDFPAELNHLRGIIVEEIDRTNEDAKNRALAMIDAMITSAGAVAREANASAVLSDPKLFHAEIIEVPSEIQRFDAPRGVGYEFEMCGRQLNNFNLRLPRIPAKILILCYGEK